MLAITKNLKKVHLNSVAIFMSLRASFTSSSHICIIVTYVENTHCWTILAQLHLSIKCFILSSTVTIETPVRIQNPLTSLHECLRTGALVPSSVCFSIPFAAVLFRCSLDFPELSVTRILTLCLFSCLFPEILKTFAR